jgi:inner membrane protein
MSARRRPWRGQGWALAALLGMAALWGWRALEHGRALALARTALEEEGAAAGPGSAPGVLAVAAEPYPFNPFHWHGIAATPAYYRDADVDTLRAAVTLNPRGPVYRAAASPAVAAASGSWLGRVYLDWARFPVVDELGPVPLPGFPPPPVDAGQRWTTVRFRDMRFLYRQPGLGDPSELRRPPLAGFVYIVDGRAQAGMFLSGREQK